MARVALILILCLVVSGCRQRDSADTEKPLAVRLAYTSQHICALVHLAAAKGFFRDEGVVIQPVLASFGRLALGQVLQGKADLATVAETPFMFAVMGGEKLSLVASIFSSGRNHAIVVTGTAKPADLRGKRIGVTRGTTSDTFLYAFLVANNIRPEEVIPVPMNPDRMLDALTSGEVDAVSVWDIWLKSVARTLGNNCTVFLDPHIYTEHFTIAGRTSFINDNQPLLRRILRALVRAEEFSHENPVEACRIVAAALKLPPDLLGELWGESRFEVQLDHSLVVSLEEESRWAMKHRLTSSFHMPNYLDHIDIRPLKAVQPNAVVGFDR